MKLNVWITVKKTITSHQSYFSFQLTNIDIIMSLKICLICKFINRYKVTHAILSLSVITLWFPFVSHPSLPLFSL